MTGNMQEIMTVWSVMKMMTVTAQPYNFSFSLTQMELSKTASNQEM
jgi:hypothetical protein